MEKKYTKEQILQFTIDKVVKKFNINAVASDKAGNFVELKDLDKNDKLVIISDRFIDKIKTKAGREVYLGKFWDKENKPVKFWFEIWKMSPVWIEVDGLDFKAWMINLSDKDEKDLERLNSEVANNNWVLAKDFKHRVFVKTGKGNNFIDVYKAKNNEFVEKDSEPAEANAHEVNADDEKILDEMFPESK